MKIGIDIDGVLIDSEKEFRVAAEIFDVTILKRNSTANKEEPRVQQKYNWTEEETNKFFTDNLYLWAQKAPIMPGAAETIKYLRSLGHELIVITARGHFDLRMKDEAYEKLTNAGIEIDKFYWLTGDKLEVCKKEKIDYMIDDFYQICKQISDSGINTLYLRDSGTMDMQENEHLKKVSNWGEIYRFFYELENNK